MRRDALRSISYLLRVLGAKPKLLILNFGDPQLCIMLRKKHKKRSKGWRDHPPSWFYDYQGLFKLYSLSVVGNDQKRYGRLAPS
jgi:RNA-directed DNA polymerase